MDKLKVVFTNKQKKLKIEPGIRMLLRRACNAVLVSEGIKGPAEVDITFVDDEMIREMNGMYRNIDAATDVLSFPLGENGIYDINPKSNAKMLGDIVISIEHADSQAKEYGHTFKREIAFLAVHSMLHLIGYDHINSKEEEAVMFSKQEKILTDIGLPRENSFVD